MMENIIKEIELELTTEKKESIQREISEIKKVNNNLIRAQWDEEKSKVEKGKTRKMKWEMINHYRKEILTNQIVEEIINTFDEQKTKLQYEYLVSNLNEAEKELLEQLVKWDWEYFVESKNKEEAYQGSHLKYLFENIVSQLVEKKLLIL